MSKRNFSIVVMALVALCSYTSYAWMDRWALKLQGEPAKLSVLSTNAVVRFLQRNYADYEFSFKYAEGGEIDLNEDGIKDYVFFVPWMGNGLNASGYYTHFIVSDGKGGRIENSLDSFGAELADVVEINGKIYFRHSCFFEAFEKSAHNHWVFQVFSFGKDGVMRNANREVGGHLPAVTIFYSDPKFKQIELTSADKAAILKGTKPQFRKFEIK
jgi:hypothetical protein